jgi:hypothetical protein
MVRGVEQFGCLLLFGLGAWAQQEAPKIDVNVEGFRYPPIAATARIQGDVIFQVFSADVDLVTGNPILARAAQTNLQTWDLPPFNGNYLVRYHFELDKEGGAHTKTVPIGNKFGRFFRHLVGAPTQKAVKNYCYGSNDPAPDPPPRYAVVSEGDVKIDVFVGAVARCLNTEASQVAQNSDL